MGVCALSSETTRCEDDATGVNAEFLQDSLLPARRSAKKKGVLYISGFDAAGAPRFSPIRLYAICQPLVDTPCGSAVAKPVTGLVPMCAKGIHRTITHHMRPLKTSSPGHAGAPSPPALYRDCVTSRVTAVCMYAAAVFSVGSICSDLVCKHRFPITTAALSHTDALHTNALHTIACCI